MGTHERAALALADSAVALESSEQLLGNAILQGADIIHLEPYEEFARVRYRIDGLLQEMGQLSHGALATLIAHFKHRANLMIDEHRWSQDGQFAFEVKGEKYVVKISTLPLTHGEKAVLRVFRTNVQVHNLAELGLWGESRQRLTKALAGSKGLVVFSGAHHAGTSTTLQSVTHLVQHDTNSIVSINEHLSHYTKGIQQLRVGKHHITPEQAIQTAMHGDANIIVIDDIHGRQSLHAAVEASAKGRLLLAGVHGSDIMRTFTELMQLSHEPFMLAHHLQAVVHQRLVRRLCNNCKVAAKPDATLLRQLSHNGKVTLSTLQKFLQETNKHQQLATMQLYQASEHGCAKCRYTGFKGRIGLFEVVPITDRIRAQLMAGADARAIAHQAIKEGMMPQLVDGFIKALCGLTTLEEVLHSRES